MQLCLFHVIAFVTFLEICVCTLSGLYVMINETHMHARTPCSKSIVSLYMCGYLYICMSMCWCGCRYMWRPDVSFSITVHIVFFFFLKTMSQYLDLFNSASPKDPPASTTPCHTSFLHGCQGSLLAKLDSQRALEICLFPPFRVRLWAHIIVLNFL